MKKYLTNTERTKIECELKCGKSLREIARALKRHHSTIIKEIKVNSLSGTYQAAKAAELSRSKLSERGAKLQVELFNNLIMFVKAHYRPGENTLENVLKEWQKETSGAPSLATLYNWIQRDTNSASPKCLVSKRISAKRRTTSPLRDL